MLDRLKEIGPTAIARHCGVSRQAVHHWLSEGIPPAREAELAALAATQGPACEVCGSRTVPHFPGSLACLRTAVAVLRAERDQARADVAMLRQAAGLSVTVYVDSASER